MSNNQADLATEVNEDVLPPESGSYPNDTSELEPRFKKISFKDAKEMIVQAAKSSASTIPGLDIAIDWYFETGKYSRRTSERKTIQMDA